MLDASPEAQALVMVPEINLTPQLEERFIARFVPRYGREAVVSMHSGMTNPQRLKAGWPRTRAAPASCSERAWPFCQRAAAGADRGR